MGYQLIFLRLNHCVKQNLCLHPFHSYGIGWFAIDAKFGSLRTNQSLDRESHSSFKVTVTATDGGVPPLSSSVLCAVQVKDLNDNHPMFTKDMYEGSIAEDALSGTSVLQVLYIICIFVIFLVLCRCEF